jgi:hypothetical protein
MTCPSKLFACTLILALMVSSIVMVNSAKVNATDSGSGSATGEITIWCYYMPYYTVTVYNETGYSVDDFYVWNRAFGTGGPVDVDYSVLNAINDGKYYSVDKLYTIKVFEEADYALVYTTYAHGVDVITIAHTDGWTSYSGNKPPKTPVSTPSTTNVPSSTPTNLNPTPSNPTYSTPPTSSAQSGNSFINDALGFLEGFGWEKAALTVTTVVIVVLALGMIVLWRRTSRLMENNRPA